MDDVRLFSPVGNLGYGVQEDTLSRARTDYEIDFIGVDGGSTDQGPNYLGQGKPLVTDPIVKRDLRLLMEAQAEDDIPLLVSTAGGSGAKDHVDRTMRLVKEVAQENGYHPTVATIYTDVDKRFLRKNVEKLSVLDFDVSLTEHDIDNAETIVAQVGIEPFVEAIDAGADIVLCGRSLDISPFAAVPIARGFDRGLAVHLGKIMECGALAAKPGTTTDGVIGRISEEYFELIYPKEDRRVTTESVASHSLYEKANPNVIHLPNGTVDVSNCKFEQIDDCRVRVRGSTFEASDTYSVLIEGVERKGYRSITPAGIRSPELLENLDSIRKRVREQVEANVDYDVDDYTLLFRTYGEDAVPLFEVPNRNRVRPVEVGIIIEVVGRTQEMANAICSRARSTLLHYGFQERKSTAGNLAFPYSPSDIEVGEVYGFSIHHLLEGIDPLETIEMEVQQL